MKKCETAGCNTQVGSKLNERYCSKCIADAKKFLTENQPRLDIKGRSPKRVVN